MVKDIQDLQLQIEAARQKYARSRDSRAHVDHGPQVGELYAFAETASDGIEWAVVLQHVDDAGLWFAVPLDQNPMVGTWDVPVSEFCDFGPATLRCGRGIWISASVLQYSSCSGQLDKNDIEQVRAKLAAMIGEEVAVPLVPQVDDDPDYQEWLSEVAAACERLQARSYETPRILRTADFNAAWTTAAGINSSSPVSLAAESSGLGAGPKEVVPSLDGIVVAEGLPGVLVALADEEGIRLMYHAEKKEQLPNVQVVIDDKSHNLTWRAISDDIFDSDPTITFMETVSIYVDGRHHCQLTS